MILFDNPVIDALRWGNAVFGFVVFFACIIKTSTHWSTFDREGKLASAFFCMGSFSMFYAAVENIVLDSEHGARSIFHAVSLALLGALLWELRGRTMFANRPDVHVGLLPPAPGLIEDADLGLPGEAEPLPDADDQRVEYSLVNVKDI